MLIKLGMKAMTSIRFLEVIKQANHLHIMMTTPREESSTKQSFCMLSLLKGKKEKNLSFQLQSQKNTTFEVYVCKKCCEDSRTNV